METIQKFEPDFQQALPETHALLTACPLHVHAAVSRLTLHGSRGPAGGWHPDSDLDLSLIVDLPARHLSDTLLLEITRTTLNHWHSEIALDLAVVFDVQSCGLKCFDHTYWQPGICQTGGMDCFGLYKIQKGFQGRVAQAGIEVRRMYPCLRIWQRSSKQKYTGIDFDPGLPSALTTDKN